MLSGLERREGDHLTGRNLDYVARVKGLEQPQCFLVLNTEQHPQTVHCGGRAPASHMSQKLICSSTAPLGTSTLSLRSSGQLGRSCSTMLRCSAQVLQKAGHWKGL